MRRQAISNPGNRSISQAEQAEQAMQAELQG